MSPVQVLQEDRPGWIGVFICQGGCGREVAAGKLLEQALRDKDVAVARSLPCLCGGPGKEEMSIYLKAGGLRTLVLVGCREKLEAYQEMMAQQGMDRHRLEIFDIRGDAKLLIPSFRASLEKARRLVDTSEEIRPAAGPVLVVGNGRSALAACRFLLEHGHEVTLADPGPALHEKVAGEELTMQDISAEEMAKRSDGRFTLLHDAPLLASREDAAGYLVTLDSPLGEAEMRFSAVLVAMDEEMAKADLSGYGEAITQAELEERLGNGWKPPQDIVMIAMDEEGRSDFDQRSMHEASHNALLVKALSASTNITVIAHEMFAFGQCELGWKKSMELGVRYVRSDKMPSSKGGMVTVDDPLVGRLSLKADLVVLDDKVAVPDMMRMANALNIALDGEGRLVRSSQKRRPAGLSQGVFLCGTAMQRRQGAGPSMEAKAAAAALETYLCGERVTGGLVAQVDGEKCSCCLTCVRLCPYRAPRIEEGKAVIDPVLCQGCGSCQAACPSRAIAQANLDDGMFEAVLPLLARREGK
jgi:heterodisulfide reductase subunit A-like polyferredoxin